MTQETLNIFWILVATGLVFIMQGGFLFVETGLTRTKNSINVAAKNALDLCLSILVFWAVGYGLMFGVDVHGLIGGSGFLLEPPDAYTQVFFLFQAMFCGTAVTIVSGAVAERVPISAYMLFSLLLAGLFYPILGHWAWGGLSPGGTAGWLGQAGFVDWAGSTVVHSMGGWFALAVLLLIGPRTGRFGPDGEVRPFAAHDLPKTGLGMILLWFGWYGFNGGSTLALTQDIGPIIVNTNLAAAAGGLSALAITWLRTGRPGFLSPINGALGGLVGITANAHAVTMGEAILIGMVAGVIVEFGESVLLRLRIDDAVGAIPVHLFCGIWGTLAVALFGDPAILGTGLSQGEQLLVQAEGILACAAVGFVVPFLVLRFVVRPLTPLRVAPHEEWIGLNVSEHGARTELHDFFQVMSEQATTGSLSLRVAADPFSEVGQIASGYNHVMDRLQEEMAKTNAIVDTAKDAIFIFAGPDQRIHFYNKAAERIFGYDADLFFTLRLLDIVPGLVWSSANASDQPQQVLGLRADGITVPLEAVLTLAQTEHTQFLVGMFRDISERKRAEESVRLSEAQFRAVFASAALGMAIIDEKTIIERANQRLAHLLQCPMETLEGASLLERVHEEDRPMAVAIFADDIGNPDATGYSEFRLYCHDGMVIWARCFIRWLPTDRRLHRRAVLIVEDITEQRRIERAMRVAASVFEGTREAIVIVRPSGQIDRVNQAFVEQLGYGEREVRGLSLHSLLSGLHAPEFYRTMEDALAKEGGWQGEVMVRRRDDTLLPYWASLTMVKSAEGSVQNRIAILTDLTERKKYEEEIWRHANFDQLTGLPNRRLFNDRVDQAIRHARRQDTHLAVCLLDLDRFKHVNDTLGHDAGDRLLIQTAERLIENLRASDTVSRESFTLARLGGDEFTILLQNIRGPDDAAAVADRVIEAMRVPFGISGDDIYTTLSIGIALFPEHGGDLETLLKKADIALYRAKDDGRDRFHFFNEFMHKAVMDRKTLEVDLRRAFEQRQLWLAYQPQVDAVSGEVTGVEALLRWTHPERGPISPGDFVPVAEATGLIVEIGRWALYEACRQNKAWQDAGFRPIKVSVNLSAVQFQDPNILVTVEEALDRSGLAPCWLELEITETVMMAHTDWALTALRALAARGVNISLDDFGTGYSSLSYLTQFPVTKIKIDQSFIRDIVTDAHRKTITGAIADLGASLGIRVNVEGVEDPAQMDILRPLGVNEFQGFLLGRPINPNELMRLLKPV